MAVAVPMAVIVPMAVVVLMTAMAVVVIAVAVVEAGVLDRGGHFVGLEQTHAEQQCQGHITLHRSQDACVVFDGAQRRFHLRQPFLAHEITFVQQQDVAVDHLSATHLRIEEAGFKILRIDQGDDRVQARLVPQLTAEEGHRHGQRIGQARGFNNDVIERVRAFKNPLDRIHQFAVD